MKTALDLLNEVCEMGIEKERALSGIDASLDEEFGVENRKALSEEQLTDELYNSIIDGFKCVAEAIEEQQKECEEEKRRILNMIEEEETEFRRLRDAE